MTISAEESRDLNGKALKYEWKVLRGDPQGVKITPKNAAGSVVDLEVAHPKRRPIAPGSPLESSRVDIGVFVHNGSHWSAPGFVTWYGLEHESRTYDAKGRVGEIAYGSGEVRLSVKDWHKLLAKENQKWFPPLTKQQSDLVEVLEKERSPLLERAKKAVAAGDDKRAKELEKMVREFDDRQQTRFLAAFGASHATRIQQLAVAPLTELADYKACEAAATNAQKNAVQSMANQLRAFELAFAANDKVLPLITGPTPFDQEMFIWLNAERLSHIVFPDALHVQRLVNYVDVRLSLPRVWRDVYLYDGAGQNIGWVRAQAGQKAPAFFTADGLLVAERDPLGRCSKAKKVTYSFETQPGVVDRYLLRWQPTAEEVEYEYRGPDDRRGKIKGAP
jgi:hypothetical protein